MSRRILLVYEEYDPGGGSRMNKFAKYLPAHGWKVIVLCREAQRNHAKPDFAPDVIVRRPLPSFGFLDRCFGWKRATRVLNDLVFVPDKTASWAVVAARVACRMARRGEIDIVLTSSPRESVHIVGWAVRRLGIPWVADFRDLWTQKRSTYHPPTRVHDWICRSLEASFYRGCDVLFANTPGNREIILAEFGLDPAQVIVIPNGYDPEDFKAFTARPTQPPMIFGYLGEFDKPVFPWREIIHVFDALNTAGVPVLLRVQGSYSATVAQEVQQLSNKCVQLHPQIPHNESLILLQNCDAALLMMYDLPFTTAIVPQKLYQYLGSGLPVLAVTPKNGCASHIVSDSGGGRIVPPDDWDRVAQVIKDMYRDWQEHKLMRVSPDAANQFSYITLMQQVTESLDNVYKTSQKPRRTAS